ncbi:hypothetical protein PanWU01x14_196110 [Parasponia andersonii]|uniref:Uncharacterized protein n=1 Tax=Parasponia andersonii TaxID=3476 RepID=A0A2P5BZM2_PARAD|nr:hypothetical protein PanWU01x14_196110 [Parasponia andersonii]
MDIMRVSCYLRVRDLGPCAGFADTPPSSVRMLGTYVTEVLQDRDERMRAHSMSSGDHKL